MKEVWFILRYSSQEFKIHSLKWLSEFNIERTSKSD
jgi:hypothetical protein